MGIDDAREMLDFMAEHQPNWPSIPPKGRIIEHSAGQGYSVYFEATAGVTAGVLIDVTERTFRWHAIPGNVSLREMSQAFRQALGFVENLAIQEDPSTPV